MNNDQDLVSAILVSLITFFLLAGLTWLTFWSIGYENMWTWRIYVGIWSTIIILRYIFGKEKK